MKREVRVPGHKRRPGHAGLGHCPPFPGADDKAAHKGQRPALASRWASSKAWRPSPRGHVLPAPPADGGFLPSKSGPALRVPATASRCAAFGPSSALHPPESPRNCKPGWGQAGGAGGQGGELSPT